MKRKIKSALISVWDKEGLDTVVSKLNELGIQIISTGGTYEYIKNLDIPVLSVEELTGQPEIMGGRVKTLHPKIFGGILYQRSSKSDKKDLSTNNMKGIDLVIVDLYPFEQTIANMENEGLTDDDAIEKIDIGGVSLIRAAAKNHKDVLVIGHKDQYSLLMQVLDNGGSTEFEERREFAIDAFNITSNYDADVFKYLLGDSAEDLSGLTGYLPTQEDGLRFSSDDNNLNDFLICWKRFGSRPNRILIENAYSSKLVGDAISDIIKEKNVFTEVIPDGESLIINDRVFVRLEDELYLSYVVIDRNSESSFIDSMLFLYKEGFDGVQDYVDLLNECLIDFQEDTGNKINAMVLSPSGLEIETVGITDYDSENIETYYSGKTFKAMEKAVKRIKGSKRGMTILYGPRGTGKTTSINYIADGLDRIVIFIPNNMIEHTINNPDFRKFLKRFDQPIIVIDDCELALNEIYNKSNVTTTNLVQMVDGFLAGTTDVSIVAIFNTDSEDDIDHNLLDCNSLLDVVEFTELSTAECNDLSKIVDGRKYKSSAKMIDVVKKRKGEQKEKVGF
jgi:hypothetical protein